MAVNDCIRSCRTCGQAFSRTQKGQPTKYCGSACLSAAKRNCVRRTRKPRTGDRRKPKLVSCAACGLDVMRTVRSRKDAAKFCSTRCAGADKRRVAAGIRATKPVVVRIHRGRCVQCAKPYQKLHPTSTYCSKACANKAAYSWVAPTRECTECRSTFLAAKWQRTCSDVCALESKRRNARVCKGTRRARIIGRPHETIDPFAVFARDKWRCQLCGVATPRELRGTLDDRAPELDHVIPISDEMGTHTWANVQCTCRKCNGLKGATPLGQLGLLAA